MCTYRIYASIQNQQPEHLRNAEMPYTIKSNFGPSFRHSWEQELNNLGVRVIHSIAYNSQSMDLVDRSVRTLTLLDPGYFFLSDPGWGEADSASLKYQP